MRLPSQHVIARSIAAAAAAGTFALPLHAQETVGTNAPESAARQGALKFVESLYKVSLNGQEFPAAYLVLESGNDLYLSEKDIHSLGIRALPATSIDHDGQKLCSLHDFPGSKIKVDRQNQTIALLIDPVTLEEMRIQLYGATIHKPQQTARGALLNYGLFTTTGVGGKPQTTGSFEAKVLTSLGIGSSSYSLAPSLALSEGRRLVRLDSAWRVDMPSQVQTLTLGDSYQRIGGLGQSVRFGGISFGTNFDLQPGLITSPLQAVSGVATLPSIVDIYVNQRLTGSRQVPPGPFSVSDIPVIGGTGQLSVVVRDMQGHEQVISRPYQVSQTLLAQGRSDYSVEAGFARQNFGLRDFDYGPFTASVFMRHGVSNDLTAEARLYNVGRDVAGGIGAVFTTGQKLGGLAQLRVIGTHTQEPVSGSRPTSGAQLTAAYARQPGVNSPDRLTYQVEVSRYSHDFQLPGAINNGAKPYREITMSAGYRLPFGQLNTGYIARQDHCPPTPNNPCSARIASVSYVLEALGGFISVSASKATGAQPGNSIFASLLIPIGKRTGQSHEHLAGLSPTSFNAEYVRNAGFSGVSSAVLARDYPAAEGVGYRLTARNNGHQDLDALWARSEAAYSVQMSRYDGQAGARLGIRGTLGAVEGRLFASRPIENSFAVVEVGDFANVPIYRDNNLVTHTDSHGMAVVPGLVPYTRNTLSTDTSVLPMGTKIDSLDSVVTPYMGGAAFVHFAVKRVRSATMIIIDAEGKLLPPGTIMSDNHGNELVVGYDGEMFVADLEALAPGNYEISTRIGSRICAARVPMEKAKGALSELGEVRCLPSK